MNAIGIVKVCKKLGLNGRDANMKTKAKVLLLKYGVKAVAEVPWGRGVARSWDPKDVERVRVAERERAVVAQARAATDQPPAPVQPQLQDDDVIAIKKAVEGQSSYICRLGERTERAERAIAQVEATQRVILIAINRLLKAANLPTVTQVHGSNGGAHTAPEAQQ